MLEVKPKEVVFYESEQILCSCRCCILRRQPDFLGQQNGVFEAIKLYNENNGSSHYCKFLPKFHPELNPIERVWSRMKWFIRQFVDGSMETLTRLMNEGLSYPNNDDMKNLTACTIRKYIRLTRAYLLAYDKGLDIVAAKEWLKQRRSHRGYIGQMDDVLEKLYFPCGRSGEASDVEVDNIENYGDVVEAMLLLGATPNIELDENAADDNYPDYVYGEDDDTPEYEELYDNGVDVNAEVY